MNSDLKYTPSSKTIEIMRELRNILPSGMICFVEKSHEVRTFSQMPRAPKVKLPVKFDLSFPSFFLDALRLNDSYHDGAIIVENIKNGWQVVALSFRLHPPQSKIISRANKGSAFNSAAAMSEDQNVTEIIGWNKDAIWVFKNGEHTEFSICG